MFYEEAEKRNSAAALEEEEDFHGDSADIDSQSLRHLSADGQLEAMTAWWFAHYEDPAQSTPYNGREGGFIYPNGGPFDPADELPHKFGGTVPDDVIQQLIDDLHSTVGQDWAPVPRDVDFDMELDVEPRERHEPLLHLTSALYNDSDQLIGLIKLQPAAQPVLLRHAYISMVAAFETYLWETTKYWVSEDESVLRNLVTKSHKFKDSPLKIGQIFERYAGLQEEVNSYLRSMVWHRLDDVKPLMECAFDISLPSVNPLLELVLIRHDLVHRNGRVASGEPRYLTKSHFDRLARLALEFCIAVETAVISKLPDETAEYSLSTIKSRLDKMGRAGSETPPDEPPDDF
jgi:hypothetical protein